MFTNKKFLCFKSASLTVNDFMSLHQVTESEAEELVDWLQESEVDVERVLTPDETDELVENYYNKKEITFRQDPTTGEWIRQSSEAEYSNED